MGIDPCAVNIHHVPSVVYIIGRYVPGDYLAGDPLAAQHGGRQRCVVEADARAVGDARIGVGKVARRIGKPSGFVLVVCDIFNDPVVDPAHHVALVLGVGGQVVRQLRAFAGCVVVAVDARSDERLEFVSQRHRLVGERVQLRIPLSGSVFPDGERVRAAALNERA